MTDRRRLRRRFRLLLAGIGVAGLFVTQVPASAAVAGSAVTNGPSVPCSVSPGHYCVVITYVSVSGGINLKKTQSTGYTTGTGKGKEWFRYSCNAGTCYELPTPLATWRGSDVQLNVTRTFGGGMFLPCGNRFGVDWIRPAVNAPGPGPLLFNVVCKRDGSGALG